jgi:biopolymer transport protein ExbD
VPQEEVEDESKDRRSRFRLVKTSSSRSRFPFFWTHPMAAKTARAFDVWFVTANTVYKAVPYNVVADWTQQGRLAPTDMVRPAGTEEAWSKVSEHDLLADFVPRAATAKRVVAAAPVAAAVPSEVVPSAAPGATEGEAVELPEPEEPPSKSRFEDDDEVDMIPLIDISMVLLVFFILVQAAGALAPVDVPEMKYAGQLTADPEAITITIDKLNTEEVFYSVRLGPGAPKASADMLKTPEQAIEALRAELSGTTRPPEVRIACRKELPRERVYELRRMLEVERKKGLISSFLATVVEAPETK